MKMYRVAFATIANVLCSFTIGCAALRQPTVASPPIVEAPLQDKIDGELRGLADLARRGSKEDVNQYVTEHRMFVKAGRVEVDITARANEAVKGLKAQIKITHTTVLTDLANHVYAMVPISTLHRIAALPDVSRIDASVPVVSPTSISPRL